MSGGIIDVELGPEAGGFRAVIAYGAGQLVLYRDHVRLDHIARDAAHAFALARQAGETYFLVSKGGYLDLNATLDGDLTAELGVRRA